jgi:hypothetical protein
MPVGPTLHIGAIAMAVRRLFDGMVTLTKAVYTLHYRRVMPLLYHAQA